MPSIRRLLPLAVLVALAVPSAASASYRAVVLAARPTAYWRLDELANGNGRVAADETGHHPGWYVGPPTRGIGGALRHDDGTAIDLDGLVTQPLGQYVAVPDHGALAFPGRAAFSLEAWVRPRSVNAVTRRIFSKEGPRGGYLLGLRSEGGLAFSRYVDGQWSTLRAPLDPTRWSHVAASFDGETMRLYVDGCLLAQGPSSLELPTEREHLSIGAKQSRWRFYAGGLDELAIYPHALSHGQVNSHARVGGSVR